MNENLILGIMQEIQTNKTVFEVFKRIVREIIAESLIELGLVERKPENVGN